MGPLWLSLNARFNLLGRVSSANSLLISGWDSSVKSTDSWWHQSEIAGPSCNSKHRQLVKKFPMKLWRSYKKEFVLHFETHRAQLLKIHLTYTQRTLQSTGLITLYKLHPPDCFYSVCWWYVNHSLHIIPSSHLFKCGPMEGRWWVRAFINISDLVIFPTLPPSVVFSLGWYKGDDAVMHWRDVAD